MVAASKITIEPFKKKYDSECGNGCDSNVAPVVLLRMVMMMITEMMMVMMTAMVAVVAVKRQHRQKWILVLPIKL